MNEYEIYVNIPKKYMRVHRSGCRYLRQRGGVSTVARPTGFYIDGLGSLEQVDRLARWLYGLLVRGKRFTLDPGGPCTECNPR